jgi:predicted nucleic acid-binding protein
MTYLLDTSAFSELMREHPAMDAHLATVGELDQVAICPIVRGEIRFGLARLPLGQRRQALETKVAELFATIPCEPIFETVGDHYAHVKLARQTKGLALDENDLWIAASALALDATLVTRDTDFQHIDGLRLEDWTK